MAKKSAPTTTKTAAKKAPPTAGKPASKPVAKAATKPAAKPVAKPAMKPVAKPAMKAVAKPAMKGVAKPGMKGVAKPAPKPVAKPALKPVAKPAPKPVAKPVAKPATKPVAKAAAKPVAKAAAKPASKPVAKPVAAAPKPPAAKPVAKAPPAAKPAKPAKGAEKPESTVADASDVTVDAKPVKKGLMAKLVDKVIAVVGGKAKPGKGHRPPPPASETPVGLSPELKARIQEASPIGSFAEHCRNLSVHAEGAWEHADMPELVGLERWGRELATKDREAGIAALVEAARFGFPRAAETGRDELVDVGFFADHPSVDGAPVETQIEIAAAWLDNPEHLESVKNAFDQTRQLNVWEDDLRPEDGRAYWWYTEVGQCCCAAILKNSGNPDGSSYYDWDPATTVARGLVMAVRGIRQEDTNVDEILDEMRDAMLA